VISCGSCNRRIILAGSERRQHIRRTVRYPAWIAVQSEKYLDCELSDISMGGAKIKVKGETVIPDRFVLAFNPQGTPNRACRVVWRKEEHLGLQFESPERESRAQELFEI
jgi:PilZ domain